MITEVQFADDVSEYEFVDAETYVNVDKQVPDEHFHAHELTEGSQCSMSKLGHGFRVNWWKLERRQPNLPMKLDANLIPARSSFGKSTAALDFWASKLNAWVPM